MAERRKMAMLVGNTVESDSRVEKAAVSAKSMGYDVYLIGIKNKTVPQFGSYQTIPIYRPIPDFSEFTAWLKAQNTELEPAEDFIDRKQREFNEILNSWELKISKLSSDIESARALPHLIAPERFPAPKAPAHDWEERVSRLTRPMRKQHQRALRATVNIKNSSDWRKSAIPGEWRNLWPQIVGFEDAFLRALRLIEPDIIHVHDRHPMSAAVKYSREMREEGIEVPWIYDAHEFLPGQRFSGPAQHRYGWLSLESEMIHNADAVITVSDEVANSIAKRHHLSAKPFVVENAPRAALTPNPDTRRQSLREELGVPDDAPLAVYVGKLAERRGIYNAVEAAAKIPNLHLAFVGSRDSKPRARILELGTQFKIRNRLHIVDYVPSNYVTSYISSADIGLSPLYSTPAHEQALATKIREYVVAGLPIVGSDLRTQGNFIRKHAIGETHDANDSRSMAEAIERALKNLTSLKANVTRIRDVHTWEKQEETLARAWDHAGKNKTVESRDNVANGRSPAGSIFSNTRSKKLAPLFAAMSASKKKIALAHKSQIYFQDERGEWWSIGPAKGAVEETFGTWRELISAADLLIATDFEPLFEDVMGPGQNLSKQLARAGMGFYNWTTANDVLRANDPDSNGSSISTRADKMKARAIQISESRRSTIISDDPSILSATESALWLPGETRISLVRQSDDLGRVVVVIGTGQRSAREREALYRVKQEYPMIDFVENSGAKERLEASVLIDTLNGGVWGEQAESAFASNVIVLADYSLEVINRLDVAPPFVSTTYDLLSVNLRLALSGRIEAPDPSEYLAYRRKLTSTVFGGR